MKRTIELLAVLALAAGANAQTVYRWDAQDPNCTSSLLNGAMLKKTSVNGMTVEVMLHDTGWKNRADVHIENHRAAPFDVHPEQFRLTALDGQKRKELKYYSPDELERSIRRRAGWAGALAAMGGAQQRTTTSQTTQNGNVDVWGSNGGSAHGTYNGTSTTTTTGPDYEAQRRANEQVRNIGAAANEASAKVQSIAMQPNTIFPSKDLYGAVYFDRTKSKEVILTVTIGSESFEFHYSYNRK
jgi:hypothetical protein